MCRITYLGTQIDQAAMENFKTQIASLKLNQGKILRDIEMLCQEKAEKKNVHDDIKKINDTLLEHSKTLEDHHNHTLTIENFLEKYLPIKVQSQISETLKAIGDKKSRRNLDQYESVKYEELHTAILEDTGHPEIIKQFQKLATISEPKFSDGQKQLNSSKTLPCKV